MRHGIAVAAVVWFGLMTAPAHDAAATKSVDQAVDDMGRLVLDALEQWRVESPQRCDSANLKTAMAFARALPAQLQRVRVDLRQMVKSGAWSLDVGDAARRAGCHQQARSMYDFVVETFVGSGYAALRDRARIGIDDLRRR